MANHLEYFEYLKTRNLKGLIYRNFVLYPKISKHVRGNLLDVGCGIGDMLRFHPNSVGVDINPYAVDYCRSKGLNAYLMQVDELPFESETFDTILLDNVLEHLSAPSTLLAEISRVLRMRGNLIIGLPGEKGFLMDIDHKVNYSNADVINLLSDFDLNVHTQFSTPFKSKYLHKHMSRYCNFYVASKSPRQMNKT
jgi:SAM-dependent methyltransferase